MELDQNHKGIFLHLPATKKQSNQKSTSKSKKKSLFEQTRTKVNPTVPGVRYYEDKRPRGYQINQVNP